MSQMKLAEAVGVSFQQIQKCEKGISRITVDRIQQIAGALGVSVHTLLEKKAPTVSEPTGKYSPKGRLIEEALLPLSPEEAQLLQLFRKIDKQKIREGLIKQLRGIIELKYLKK